MLLKLCFICLNIFPLFDSAPLDGTPKSAKLSRVRTSGKSTVTSSTDNIFPQDCGVRKIRNTPRGRVKRIVGGSQSSQGKWPWQAALFYKGTHYCGGAIISNTWILAAGHCFNPHTSEIPADWTVVLGDHHIKERNDKYEQRRKVVNITIHEGYKSMYFEGILDTPPKNDVAILKLDKPLTFTDFVQPLCLPRPDQVFAPNDECYVAGWGHTQWNGTQPDILREAKVRTVSREVCNAEKSYNGTIHDTALCAGFPEGRIDACEYDSGGPLVCAKCGRYYALGLVSWGDQCALPNKYGVYADLRVLTPWVKEKIMNYETG